MSDYPVSSSVDTLLKSANQAAMRTSLALGDAATKNVGTTTGSVAAGDDSRIAGAVQTSRTVSAGTGLSGGGDLSQDRTLSVSFGTAAGTACQGNDSRLSDSRTPAGAAGGDLGGTFPNPSVNKLRGFTVSNQTPQTNQVLTWNGSQWIPSYSSDSNEEIQTYLAIGNVGSTYSGGISVPAGYKYVDILACSGGGGGGAGHLFMTDVDNGSHFAGGGGGGSNGIVRRIQRIYCSGIEFSYELGRGGLGGIPREFTGAVAESSSGQDGGFLKLWVNNGSGLWNNGSKLVQNQQLLYIPGGAYGGGAGNSNNGGAGYTQQNGRLDPNFAGGNAGSGHGAQPYVTSWRGADFAVTHPGGGGGSADSSTAYDGGAAADANEFLLDAVNLIPVAFHGYGSYPGTSNFQGPFDALPISSTSPGLIECFFGGAGGGGAFVSSSGGTNPSGRGGDGANGMPGCGGGGGGGCVSQNPSLYMSRGGSGGNGGPAFIMFTFYK
jgi:hypothetical protein